VRLQAQFRGRTDRKKVNAATKIESFYRMHVLNSAYRKLKSATIALQCRARRALAKKVDKAKAKPSTSRSSPPPTKEIYTKAQEKAVEDVLLASKNGNASHYKVLNLPANASDADIKKRYKKLALKLHPDKNRAPLAG